LLTPRRWVAALARFIIKRTRRRRKKEEEKRFFEEVIVWSKDPFFS